MTDAQRLAAAFVSGGPLTELTQPPADVAAAYEIQDAMRAALGKPIAGWKLAQTVPPAQAAAGLDAPTVSPLLEGMIYPDGTEFPADRFLSPEAEAEIVLELADAITAPATPDEVKAACAGYRLAIEMADSRYADKPSMGAKAVIADMNSSNALIIGELRPIDGMLAVARGPLTLTLGDGTVLQPLGADWRPNPFEVVAFLSQFATARGHTLEAGAVITTGTHTKPTRTGPGTITATFEGVGSVSCKVPALRGA
ncbi:2-keto-4-pentenoate hydratase [Acuticoccus sp. I52.16.1]|uniref:2-keto-4-pentenoate hydratase n=1 Tax=Acuticoccus sp. I52.16.1 TaxID=2928472 RepID=UPI001FD4F4A6|nr:fumarylacetoacetate hydrolase family protein [Acuticoccus sp. I52.16.1]UOM35135.1 fumarylacetoacetate hydrolase family protein [Acuticoccus sp. I52.16.1]